MPLLAFGGAAVMAIVGALVGRRFALQDGKRSPPVSISMWRGLGLFVGFGLGAFAGVGLIAMLHQLFGEAIAPPWLLIPLFFSCPIGGAIAGLWTGGRMERFLQKKRAARTAKAGGTPQ
jgi:hypothetical protein